MKSASEVLLDIVLSVTPTDDQRHHIQNIFTKLRRNLLEDIPEAFEVVIKGSISRKTDLTDYLGYKSDIDCIAFLTDDAVNGRWQFEQEVRERLLHKKYNVRRSAPGPFICFEFHGIEVDCVLQRNFKEVYSKFGFIPNTSMMLIIKRRTEWEINNQDALGRYNLFTVDVKGEDGIKSEPHVFGDGMFGSGNAASKELEDEVAQLGHPLLFNELVPGMNHRYNNYWRYLIILLKQSKIFLDFHISGFHIEYNVFDVLRNGSFLNNQEHVTFLEFVAAFMRHPNVSTDRLLMRDPGFVSLHENILFASELSREGRERDAIITILRCFGDPRKFMK